MDMEGVGSLRRDSLRRRLREKRFLAAQALVPEFELGGKWAQPGPPGADSCRWPKDELRWRSLIHPAACRLAALSAGSADLRPQPPAVPRHGAQALRGHFALEGAGPAGGPARPLGLRGIEACIGAVFADLLASLHLEDEDTLYVLLGAYGFLLAEDLPLCSQTWRALLATSVRAAIERACGDRQQKMLAQWSLQRHVADWWPHERAESAYQAFVGREAFRQQIMGDSAALQQWCASLSSDLSDATNPGSSPGPESLATTHSSGEVWEKASGGRARDSECSMWFTELQGTPGWGVRPGGHLAADGDRKGNRADAPRPPFRRSIKVAL